MKIINAQGNVVLKNKAGIEEIVISVKHGATYGVKNIHNLTTTLVKIFLPHNGLEDHFIFYAKDEVPLNHIQTRELNPYLRKLYIQFFLSNDYSIINFIDTIITKYFIDYAGYSYSDNVDVSAQNIKQ